MYWFYFQANKSALWIAAANGHKEIVKFLVERHNFVLTEEDSVSSHLSTISVYLQEFPPCLQYISPCPLETVSIFLDFTTYSFQPECNV